MRENVQDLQDTSSLFVDKTRDTLDTSTTGETTDSRLGNTPASQSCYSNILVSLFPTPCAMRHSRVKDRSTHWMLSRRTFLCRLAPPLPRPLPPLPRPDIVYDLMKKGKGGKKREYVEDEDVKGRVFIYQTNARVSGCESWVM